MLGNNVSSDTATMEVGTLYKAATGGKASTHEGQYTMLFELGIDALSCFGY